MNQQGADGTCVDLLKALADDTRLAVVEQLMRGPRHVAEINEDLQIDATLLSHHLRVLRDAGIVEGNRIGKQIHYALTSSMRRRRGRGVDLGCCSIAFK